MAHPHKAVGLTKGDTKLGHLFAIGFVAGVALCVVLYGLTIAFVDLESLKEWQDLAAGLLGVTAAVATVVFLEKQISVTRDLQEDQRERREYADRASMPAALAELVRYGEANLLILVSLRSGLRQAGNIRFTSDWVSPKPPDYPSSAAETLRACLVNTDRDNREPIAQIMRDLQLLHSRLEMVIRDVSVGTTMSISMSNLSSYIVGALDFLVRCNHTIPYARCDEPSPPAGPSADQMSSKAHFANIYEDDYPFVHEEIRRFYVQPS